MKKSTAAKKLAALLGIEDDVDTSKLEAEEDRKKKKPVSSGGVSEDQIQNFRAAQGMLYFLQAPELFSSKICRHCGVTFLVSRQQVSCCSYTCIEKELEKLGINWSRKGEYETIAQTVYEGNEPIWIRNLEVIKELIGTYVPTDPPSDPEPPKVVTEPPKSALDFFK